MRQLDKIEKTKKGKNKISEPWHCGTSQPMSQVNKSQIQILY